MKGWLKGILRAIAGVIGFVLVVLVTAQIILSPKVFTSLVNRYSPDFLAPGASLTLSGASVSIFSHFPAVSADIDDLLITYPAEMFDSLERIGSQDHMVYAGTFRSNADSSARCPMDTLASLRKCNVSLSLLPLLHGVVRIKNAELTHPHAFIHYYGDGSSNLDIFRLPSSEEEQVQDTTETSAIRKVVLNKLFVGSDARIVYSNQRDSLYALMMLQTCALKGRISSSRLSRSRCTFNLDSLLVLAIAREDTVMFDLNHFHVKGGHGRFSTDALADFHLATHALGRFKVPMALGGNITLDRNRQDTALGLEKFFVEVAGLHLDTEMSMELGQLITMKGYVDMPPVKLQSILDDYASHLVPECGKISTNASLSARLDVDGFYDASTGQLPAFDLSLSIPESYVAHRDFGVKPKLCLSLAAAAQQSGPVEAHLKKCRIDATALLFDATADVSDLLGDDPAISLDASAAAELDKVEAYLPPSLGLDLGGKLSAAVKGHLNKSDLDLYDMGKADLDIDVNADKVVMRTSDDSLKLYCNSLSLRAGLMENRFARKRSSAVQKTFGAVAKLDSISFVSEGLAHLTGKNFSLITQSSPERISLNDTTEYYPMMAALDMGSVFLEGEDSLNVRLKDSRSSYMVYPSRTDKTIPVIRVSSRNGRLRAKMGPHRVFFKQLDFAADARMSGLERRRRLNAYRDSVFRAHPSWSRDSLMNYMRRNARNARGPKWLKEDDFKSSDISIDLGESLRDMFLMWDINGSLGCDMARISTPAFPLRTSVRGFKGSFNNDKVAIDSLRIVSGASDLEAKGAVTNLRNALMRNGHIRLNAGLTTDSLAVSEVLNAFAQGQKNMQTDLAYLANVDDEHYDKVLETQSEAAEDAQTGLIVVPGNVDARLTLRGKGVSYSNLDISDVNADILMRNRCLQILNTKAVSSVGDVYLDAFYSTKSKKDLTTGFDLSLRRISAEDVIDLIPQMDTIMPLLKTFGGLLDCNVAATASLDTNMNILMPSINGVIRLSGKDLHFNDNKKVEKIARLLLVRNPKRVTIDTMTVEGVVKDNYLEVFPFMLKVDRWNLALAGIQNLDQSFNYNISITKSPFLIKMGASVYGPDFDHMKIKLGKPQYRSAAIPTFSSVVDTTRINLRSSIRDVFVRGVERSVRESRNQEYLNRERKRMNYSRASAAQPLEELSAADEALLDSLNRVEKFREDSLRCAPVMDTISDPVRRAAFIDSLRVANNLSPLTGVAGTPACQQQEAAAVNPKRRSEAEKMSARVRRRKETK